MPQRPPPVVNCASWKPCFLPWVLGKWRVLGEASLPPEGDSPGSGSIIYTRHIPWFIGVVGQINILGFAWDTSPLDFLWEICGMGCGSCHYQGALVESVSPNASCPEANLFASRGLRVQS